MSLNNRRAWVQNTLFLYFHFTFIKLKLESQHYFQWKDRIEELYRNTNLHLISITLPVTYNENKLNTI